jgi:hypothetical protein
MVNIFNGSFISTGNAQPLNLRGGLDTIEVWNMSEMAAANASHGVEYVWNLGYAYNDGSVNMRNAAATADFWTTSATLGVPGFITFDSSTQVNGPTIATTDFGTTAHVVLTGNTTGVSVGSVIQLENMTGANQVNGMQYTVTAVVPNVSMTLGYTPVTVAAVGAGQYHTVPFNTWYPATRYISSISQAAQAVVQFTVQSNYQVGQAIRFYVGPANGMTQINGLEGNIVAVTPATNSVTVDINTSAFTPFVWPTTAVAAAPFTQAYVNPIGMDSSLALFPIPPQPLYPPFNTLTDAMVNIGSTGIILGAGITSPAGTIGQQIFWRATTSFNL